MTHLITPYCMPGSDTIRSAIAAVRPFPLNITFAFWNNGWDSGDPDNTIIQDIRKNGGEATISYGGYSGCQNNQEPALQNKAATPIQVMQKYLVPIKQYSITYVDFDIEGGKETDQTTFQLRNSAIALLQKQVPNLKISFTVPADQNGIYCQSMLTDAINKGVKIDTVRLMLMDFSNKLNMKSACISGLQNSYKILTSIGLGNTNLGFIPLLGLDDSKINTYTLDDHNAILLQIKSNNMTYVKTFSFWELALDKTQTFGFLKAYISNFGNTSTATPKPAPSNPVPIPAAPKPVPCIPVNTKICLPWKSGETYCSGNNVSYQGHTYKCIIAHKSIITWEPSQYTQALWQLIL